MRFMTMVKCAERFGAPPPALLEAIGKLGAEAARIGEMQDTGGFLPMETGARIRLAKGDIQLSEGPFAETEERTGGYAIWVVDSKQDAIERSIRFLELHRQHWPGWEGEIELRQLFDAPHGAQVS